MIRATKGSAAATALALVLAGGTAAAQKSGGILRVYSAEKPARPQYLRAGNTLGPGPADGRLQQSDPIRPACGTEQPRDDQTRPRDKMVMERRRHGTDIHLAPGCEVARRPAVHRQGRAVHDGSAARQGQGQGALQPAQVELQKPRSSDRG